ncbi:hypothetical protein A0H81_12972 [Grifola frondosa]|uniref:Uncharacterized protein n=1 Tax=Grifola frondosa TaxID=5627 RepID=A0A1C7LQA1_GRIFR|nr:hypothetical protein A0H81_12972 [Grifola frondosa]
MSSPQPLPSPPYSPDEEDISRAGKWPEEGPSHPGAAHVRNGKERAMGPDSDHTEGEGDESEHFDSDLGTDGYPPTNDQEAESQRVAETLRQWEMAERQRRKAARDSAASANAAPSFVSDVTRRASLLWPSRMSRRASSGGVGTHHMLRTTDDSVPLDNIDPHHAISIPSPDPAENPFATPNASRISLNEPQQSAIMHASGDSASLSVETVPAPASSSASRPMLEAYSLPKPPPPEPLGLPPPRSPPPRTATPHANRPPEPIPRPAVTHMTEDEPEPKPTRWWTEWLCGCTEGADRGGDHQAGRTNPFE